MPIYNIIIHAGRQFYKCSRRDGGCDFFLWADQAPSSSSGSSSTDFNHSTVTATASYSHYTDYSSSSSTASYNSASNRQPSLLSVHRTRRRGGRGRHTDTRGGSGRYRGSRDEQDQGDHSGMGFGEGFESQARSGSNSDSRQTIVCNCGTEAVQRTVQKEGPNKGRQFFTCCKPRDDQCGFFEWADNVPLCYVKQTRGGSRGRGRGRGRGGAKSTQLQNFSTDGSTSRKTRVPPTCSVCRQQGHTKRSCPQAKQLS